MTGLPLLEKESQKPYMGPENVVVQEVVRHFSAPKFKRLSTRKEYPVQMGVYKGRADVALIDGDEKVAAIIECKKSGYEGSGPDQLKGYLAATDTPLGVFANETDPADWTFYENQGRNQFNEIDRSRFEARILKRGIIKTLGDFVKPFFQRPPDVSPPPITPPPPDSDPPIIRPDPPHIIHIAGDQSLQNDNNTDLDPSLDGKPYYSEASGFHWAANHHGMPECVPQHVKRIISDEELQVRSNREQFQAEIGELVDEKNGLEGQKREYEREIGQRSQELARKKEELAGLEVQLQAPTETELTPLPVEVPDPDATKQQLDAEMRGLLEEKDKVEQEIEQRSQALSQKREELAGLEVQLQAPTETELNLISAEGATDDTQPAKQSKGSLILQSIFPAFSTIALLGLLCYLFVFYASAGDKAFSSGTGSVQQQLNEIVNHDALSQAWQEGNWFVLLFPFIFLVLAILTHLSIEHKEWLYLGLLLAATFAVDSIIAIKISQRIHDDKVIRGLIEESEDWTMVDLNILAVLLLGFAVSLLLSYGFYWTLQLWKGVGSLRRQSKEQEIREVQIKDEKIQRDAQIAVLKAEMETLQSEIGPFQSDIGRLNEKVKTVQQKIDEWSKGQLEARIKAERVPIETQIAILKIEMDNLQGEIDQFNDKVKTAQQRIDQCQAKIEELSDRQNQRVINGHQLELRVNRFLNGWGRFVANSGDETTDASVQINRIKQLAYETLNQYYEGLEGYSSQS